MIPISIQSGIICGRRLFFLIIANISRYLLDVAIEYATNPITANGETQKITMAEKD